MRSSVDLVPQQSHAPPPPDPMMARMTQCVCVFVGYDIARGREIASRVAVRQKVRCDGVDSYGVERFDGARRRNAR
jgi:hypothetical protein